MERGTSTLAKGFICQRCVEAMKGIVEPAEEVTFQRVFVAWAQIKCWFWK